MKLFSDYIKQRRRGIALGAVCCLIFIISFFLYHLPVKAVIYPALLCAVFGIVFAVVDFRRVKRRSEFLSGIKSLTDAVSLDFPKIDGIEDENYQRIISLICEEQKEYRDAVNMRYADMVDYYTVWAHQIKTPIASMRLSLQGEDSALSRRLSAELFRIEQYVEMVLTFLRLDSESTDYLIKEYDLDCLIKQAVKKFSGEFIDRKLGLDYQPIKVNVITDEKWLSFVIEQILSNALKYTPEGGISVVLESPATLVISDTGIGIAPEDLPRIFEKGYTGYNGRSDKKASGIGLYLCKRVCDNLGHGIPVKSELDKGTAVRLDLSRRNIRHE